MHEEGEDRGRLFANLWPVAPRYLIADGQVCPQVGHRDIPPGSTKGCRMYKPMDVVGLPTALAKAATGLDRDVLEFVGRYGLLGYGPAIHHEPLISARHLDGHGDAALRGDPLPWVIAHAKTVNLVLDLIGSLLTDADVRGAIDLLRVRDGGRDLVQYTYASRGHLRPMRHTVARVMVTADGKYRDAAKADPRTVARHIIASVLNENIVGVSRHLVVEWQQDVSDAEGFTSVFATHNLLDAVYWQLADAAIGGLVRRCAYPLCGAFFIAKSLKPKYCPPMGDSEVSPCMNRHKQRNWRLNNPTPKPISQPQKGKRR